MTFYSFPQIISSKEDKFYVVFKKYVLSEKVLPEAKMMISVFFCIRAKIDGEAYPNFYKSISVYQTFKKVYDAVLLHWNLFFHCFKIIKMTLMTAYAKLCRGKPITMFWWFLTICTICLFFSRLQNLLNKWSYHQNFSNSWQQLNLIKHRFLKFVSICSMITKSHTFKELKF